MRAEPDHRVTRWIVELNIAGYRIRRSAARRRDLLSLNRGTFSAPRP